MSHALQRLRKCSIVTTEKQGREVIYALDETSPVVKEGSGTLFELVEAHIKKKCSCCKDQPRWG